LASAYWTTLQIRCLSERSEFTSAMVRGVFHPTAPSFPTFGLVIQIIGLLETRGCISPSCSISFMNDDQLSHMTQTESSDGGGLTVYVPRYGMFFEPLPERIVGPSRVLAPIGVTLSSHSNFHQLPLTVADIRVGITSRIRASLLS